MRKPNIIFIMADDMGFGDVGCYNPESKIPTPNMDKVAKQGMRFTDAHSSSAVCTPSRYGVLTGRYCWRTSFKKGILGGYSPPLIERERLTIAGMLKNAGYNTACIGKWHLGLGYRSKPGESLDFEDMRFWHGGDREFEEKIDFSQGTEGGPNDLGFDYSFITAECSTSYPPFAFIENARFTEIPSVYHKGTFSGSGLMVPGWEHEHVDPAFAKKAVSYIESQTGSENPFFLYLAPSAPHEPCVESVIPEFALGKSKAGSRGDLVWLFDWVVGQVMDALDRTGQADNTLLVVTSDNGALPGDIDRDEEAQVHRQRLDIEEKEAGFPGTKIINIEEGIPGFITYGHKSCGDWRGYKSHIWEGGHREPFIVQFPGVVESGTTQNHLIGFNDFYATCAELTGEKLPNNAAEDSYSFLPALIGKETSRPGRDDLIHHSDKGVLSIRKGQWKLVAGTRSSGGWPPPRGERSTPGAPGQLYNIAKDPAERNNLFDECPEVVRQLTELLERYQEEGRSVPKR